MQIKHLKAAPIIQGKLQTMNSRHFGRICGPLCHAEIMLIRAIVWRMYRQSTESTLRTQYLLLGAVDIELICNCLMMATKVYNSAIN